MKLPWLIFFLGDVFSFGIILYEIYGRQGPYGDSVLSWSEIVEKVRNPEGIELMRPDLELLEESELDYTAPNYVIGERIFLSSEILVVTVFPVYRFLSFSQMS